jgi:hypothetical protein
MTAESAKALKYILLWHRFATATYMAYAVILGAERFHKRKDSLA